METVKTTIVNLIDSCFKKPKFALPITTNNEFIVRISLDEDRKQFPITISFLISTLEDYLHAPEESKTEYRKRVEKEIKHRVSKFTGEPATWEIRLHVPL